MMEVSRGPTDGQDDNGGQTGHGARRVGSPDGAGAAVGRVVLLFQEHDGELPPLTVVLCRVVLAALALNLVLLLSGRRMPADPRLWGAFFITGVLNNVIPFSLIFWGQ